MAAPSDAATAEYDWLFEYIHSVFQAPTWEMPIGSFIDENCIVFDGEDENKLAYTEVHQSFCKLVDELLEQHLTEIGIGAEDFVSICAKAKDSRDLNTAVFDKLVAMEDYIHFKEMMTKRNTDLEMEAMAALGGVADDITPLPEPAVAEEAPDAAAATAPVGGETAEEMEAALAASVAEYERAKRLADMELAEMEEAIAASLALEQERLAKLEALAAGGEAETGGEGKEEGGGKVEEAPAAPAPTQELMALAMAPDATSAATADHAARGVKPAETPAPAPAPAPAAAPTPAPAPAPAPTPAPAAAEGKSSDAPAPYDPWADTGDIGGFGAAGQGGSLPPIGGAGGFGMSKLPGIIQGARANVSATEESLAALKRERAALKDADATGRATLDREAQAKMQERAAHLRKQRDMIVAKKKAEREAKLAQYSAKGGSGGDSATQARVAAAVGGLMAEPAPAPAAAASGAPPSLTASLAAKVRADYLTSEERKRLSDKQASHVSLQQRLASAQAAAERSAAAQAKAMQGLRQVAATRAAAVMSSAPVQ